MFHDAAGLLERIDGFVRSCRDPVLLEPGEEALPLVSGSYALEERPGSLGIEAWNESRNLARRITAITAEGPGRLDLAVELFGNLLRLGLALEIARLELGALALELLLVGFVGAQSLAFGQQEVASVPVLHVDDIAHLAETADTLQKNNLHCSTPV